MGLRLLLTLALCMVAVGFWTKKLRQYPVQDWGGAEPECVAVSLTNGRGWSDALGPETGATAHVAPVYPLILSVIYRVFGSYETATGRRALEYFALVNALVVLLLLPPTALKLGLPEATGWTGAFLATWLRLNPWDLAVQFEQGLTAVALIGLLWTCCAVGQSGWSGTNRMVLAGLYLGFTALLGPNLLLAPALFFLVELARCSGERMQVIRGGLLAGAVCSACVLPWTVRNYVALGGFVPIRSNFGLELAVGNRAGANGRTHSPGFAKHHPTESHLESDRLKQVGELAYMKEKQRQAAAWIVDNPKEFIWLTGRRAWLFWFGTDERWCTTFKGGLSHRVHGMIGIAVLVELFRLLRRNLPSGWLLACTCLGGAVPYFITHVDDRYRLPLFGVFALISCNLAVDVVRWTANNRYRSVSASPSIIDQQRCAA